MNALALAPDIDDDHDEDREYSFADLSPRAKERARDDYRRNGLDHDWWDGVYDDANTVARLMGIEIDTPTERTTKGRTYTRLAIYFSGFCSQGDGACFTGYWHPLPHPLASLSAVMEHAPKDDELHEIALALAHMSERCMALIPDASVRVTQGHLNYCHEHSVTIDVDLPTPDRIDEDNQLQMMVWNALVVKNGLDWETFEPEAADVLRRFMKWIYRQLEAEHDWLHSDENVDEALADLKFDEDGDWLP